MGKWWNEWTHTGVLTTTPLPVLFTFYSTLSSWRLHNISRQSTFYFHTPAFRTVIQDFSLVSILSLPCKRLRIRFKSVISSGRGKKAVSSPSC